MKKIILIILTFIYSPLLLASENVANISCNITNSNAEKVSFLCDLSFSNLAYYNELLYLSYHITDLQNNALRYENDRFNIKMQDNKLQSIAIDILKENLNFEGINNISLTFDIVDEKNKFWYLLNDKIELNTQVISLDTSNLPIIENGKDNMAEARINLLKKKVANTEYDDGKSIIEKFIFSFKSQPLQLFANALIIAAVLIFVIIFLRKKGDLFQPLPKLRAGFKEERAEYNMLLYDISRLPFFQRKIYGKPLMLLGKYMEELRKENLEKIDQARHQTFEKIDQARHQTFIKIDEVQIETIKKFSEFSIQTFGLYPSEVNNVFNCNSYYLNLSLQNILNKEEEFSYFANMSLDNFKEEILEKGTDDVNINLNTAIGYFADLLCDKSLRSILLDNSAIAQNPMQYISMVEKSNNIAILNPSLSNVLIRSKSFLEELSEKTYNKLILATTTKLQLVETSWYGFSYFEHHLENYHRWALGYEENDENFINLYNTTNSPLKTKISFNTSAIYHEKAELACSIGSFKEEKVYENNHIYFEFEVELPVGKSKLDFNFKGKKGRLAGLNDPRSLVFCINNFKVEVLNKSVCLYDQVNNFLFTDSTIRKRLHSIGFMMVSGVYTVNNGLMKHRIPASQYNPYGSYHLDNEEMEKFVSFLAKNNAGTLSITYIAYKSDNLERLKGLDGKRYEAR